MNASGDGVAVGALSGFTIGVTADRRADEQIRMLSGRGAACVHGPAIKTLPLDDDYALRAATNAVIDTPPEITVITTGIGIRGWLEAADAAHLGEDLRRVLANTSFVARGPKAVGALVTAGFEVTGKAQNDRYDDVVELLAEQGVDGVRVAVQLDGGAAATLCDRITELGAEVLPVPVYRWTEPDDRSLAERLVLATCARQIDGLTFTARPAVEHFLAIAGDLGVDGELRAALSGPTVAFCVGPVCAAGLTDAGLPAPQVPERTRLGAMVQLITNHFRATTRQLNYSDASVLLQGRMVVVSGSQPAHLTDREHAVLCVLAERPGVVLSKQQLLRRVWSDQEGDEHVVEVTVGRLRRQLGPAADTIETVIRRGYRLRGTVS